MTKIFDDDEIFDSYYSKLPFIHVKSRYSMNGKLYYKINNGEYMLIPTLSDKNYELSNKTRIIKRVNGITYEIKNIFTQEEWRLRFCDEISPGLWIYSNMKLEKYVNEYIPQLYPGDMIPVLDEILNLVDRID